MKNTIKVRKYFGKCKIKSQIKINKIAFRNFIFNDLSF